MTNKARQIAIQQGSRTYIDNKPCTSGHIEPKITKTYRCTLCKSQWEHTRRLTHTKQDKAIRYKESQKNRASYKRRENAYWKRLKETYGEEYVTILRTENSSRRRNATLQATPPWYDKQKALQFYIERNRLNELTGIPHQVDHIVPIGGKDVCGLHWHGNFQVLTKEANNSKSNKFSS